MPRAAASVRTATEADLPDLLRLWQEFHLTWRGRRGPSRDPVDMAARFVDLMSDPGARLLVAADGGEVVGMALLTRTVLGPLAASPALQMSSVVVARGHRHRGIGRALVAAAAAHAEEQGIAQITVNVPQSLRDANRFYARLGFAPVVVRRTASVAALHRRLAVPARRLVVEDVVRRRTLGRPRLPQPAVTE